MPKSLQANMQLSLPAAADLAVRKWVTAPVITAYALGMIVFRIVTTGYVDDLPLRLKRREVSASDFYKVRRALLGQGLLIEDRSLPRTVLKLAAEHQKTDPGTVLCAVDPFGFVSHLSAMAYHGLSNRLPKVFFFTSLSQSHWTDAAAKRMERDLGDAQEAYFAAGLPLLKRTVIDRIQGMVVNYTRCRQTAGAFRSIDDGLLRVSTVGRTFLDMLQRPDLCGGMQHVIETFESHATENLTLIINELNAQANKIDRVRAGYILEDRCGIIDPRIDQWTVDAQRGGSRRLDGDADYASTFSEKWMLSINA